MTTIINSTYSGPVASDRADVAFQIARACCDRDLALSMCRSAGQSVGARDCRLIGRASLPLIDARIAAYRALA